MAIMESMVTEITDTGIISTVDMAMDMGTGENSKMCSLLKILLMGLLLNFPLAINLGQKVEPLRTEMISFYKEISCCT